MDQTTIIIIASVGGFVVIFAIVLITCCSLHKGKRGATETGTNPTGSKQDKKLSSTMKRGQKGQSSAMSSKDAYKTQVIMDLRSGRQSNRIQGIPNLPPLDEEEEDAPLPGGLRGPRNPGLTAPIKRLGDPGMTAPIKRMGDPGMTAPIKRLGDSGMTAAIKTAASGGHGDHDGGGKKKKHPEEKKTDRPERLPKGGFTAPIKPVDDEQ